MFLSYFSFLLSLGSILLSLNGDGGEACVLQILRASANQYRPPLLWVQFRPSNDAGKFFDGFVWVERPKKEAEVILAFLFDYEHVREKVANGKQ